MQDAPAKRVLIAEDEALIAMLIEDEAASAGFDIVGPFATCADASRWLATDTPDVAILDHELADGPCTEVAIELRRRGVPLIVASAFLDEELPEAFHGASRISKPDSMERLPALLLSLVDGR